MVGDVVEFSKPPAVGEGGQEGGRRMRRTRKRECPVPKPGGILGEWLGFHSNGGGEGQQEGRRPDR